MKQKMFNISKDEFELVEIYPLDRNEADYFESQEELKNER